MDESSGTPFSAENTAEKQQRGRPFKPGRSGNPKGRPKGSRNKITLALEALLDDESDAILRKAIDKAKEGDATALRLCLDRLMPPRRDREVAFDMPAINGREDLRAASGAVLQACASGQLTPDEAVKIMTLLTQHIRTIEVQELVDRIGAVESQLCA